MASEPLRAARSLPDLAGRRVLVTGAGGFIGEHLVGELLASGARVRGAMRRPAPLPRPGVEYVMVGDLGPETDWSQALEGIELVVHAAARVHSAGASDREEAEHRRVNMLGTRQLAAQAAARGVRRFVFLSSIKVNGESTAEQPFRAADAPAPRDAYGRSKLAAETSLLQVAAESSLEAVIVRPPLVYGPRAGANFARLVGLVKRGVPLPLGAVDNRRSFLGVGNLVSLIGRLLVHPAAVGRVWLASDGVDLSTPEFVRRIAGALGRPARLVPVPPAMLVLGARMLGLAQPMRRLTESLQLDMGPVLRELGWRPPFSVDEGLNQAVSGQRRPTAGVSLR